MLFHSWNLAFWLIIAFHFSLKIGNEMKEIMVMEVFASSRNNMPRVFWHAHLLSNIKEKKNQTKASQRILRYVWKEYLNYWIWVWAYGHFRFGHFYGYVPKIFIDVAYLLCSDFVLFSNWFFHGTLQLIDQRKIEQEFPSCLLPWPNTQSLLCSEKVPGVKKEVDTPFQIWTH